MTILKGRVDARRIVIDAYVSDRDSPHNSKECRGLVDTGSPVSGIPEEWGDELGLTPIGTSPDAWRVGNNAVDLWQCRANIAGELALVTWMQGFKAMEVFAEAPAWVTEYFPIITDSNNAPVAPEGDFSRIPRSWQSSSCSAASPTVARISAISLRLLLDDCLRVCECKAQSRLRRVAAYHLDYH